MCTQLSVQEIVVILLQLTPYKKNNKWIIALFSVIAQHR